MEDQLTVRSHVGRDILQTAALFKTDKAVIWEYVSNGLDYIDDGTVSAVYVQLDLTGKCVSISDNGRGMDWAGLTNYFTMHGENEDRKSGRAKRGLFGTGKSAAFGIAELLRVCTVRSGRRSVVELSRAQIKMMKSGEPVPVRTIEREVATDEPNGTRIEIEGIRLKRLDQHGVVRHIEQNLSRLAPNATVYVNHHRCAYQEPPAVAIHSFAPDELERQLLGDVTLTVKVAGAPLDEAERGIAVTSRGVLYERTLAGLNGRDHAQYLFGQLDVPRLDIEGEEAAISPFDMSRSMTLNIENPLVLKIMAFIGRNLEQVRLDLARRERERKVTEEARKLASEASEIARTINDDFSEFRQKVAKIDARARGGVDPQRLEEGTQGERLVAGQGVAASHGNDEGGLGSTGGRRSGGEEARTLGAQLERDDAGVVTGVPAVRSASGSRSKGGFQVRFENMGEAEMRAKYARDDRTIYVNLDHPQIVAAKKATDDEQRLFRHLAYEIAFSEYAIALASELDREGEYIEPSDSIVDIRATINRLARRAARLFE